MNNIDTTMILTIFEAVCILIIGIFLIFKKLSDYFGWFAKRKEEKQAKKRKELTDACEVVVEQIIEKNLQPTLNELKQRDEKLRDRDEEQRKRISRVIESNKILLRYNITDIYARYYQAKKLPHYMKQSATELYEEYAKENGNSYASHLVEEIKDWEEI